jgi:AraC-like DNA-binding protein
MVRPVEEPGVRLLEIGASDTAFQAFQETWDVCLVAGGAADWRYRGREMTSAPGSVRLKEPGERFRTSRVHRPTGYVIVQIEPAALSRYMRGDAPCHLQANQVEGSDASAIAHLVHRAHRSDTSLERGSVLADLVDVALVPRLERARRDRPDLGTNRTLRRAYDYVAAHFSEEIPIAVLAGLAGMHEVSFVRAFRRTFGIPPHRLQTELRIRSAKRLLDLGASGAEVAARLGFHDQSHLTRHFKSIVGLTPGRYLATRR